MQSDPSHKQSFLSSVSKSGLQSKKSPSPSARSSVEIPHHQLMIQQLQEELNRKDKQIRHYKKYQPNNKSAQQLHSEENVLDDIDKEDSYNQYVMHSGIDQQYTDPSTQYVLH